MVTYHVVSKEKFKVTVRIQAIKRSSSIQGHTTNPLENPQRELLIEHEDLLRVFKIVRT